jgi:glycosyltransferase involved in cell wall biosynthesis
MNKLITVFTPTYNRAYCLHQVYDSLCTQTSQNFVWLIVDDGSSDDTSKLVDRWVASDKIKIQYVHQENQGMHGGHNTAYEHVSTELNFCCDSDDFLPNNAIEIIESKWTQVSDFQNVAGMVGLDVFKTGKVVGSSFPERLEFSTLQDIYHVHKCTGDKKLVLRTDVVKKYPKYPLFAGERFVPLDVLYQRIDQDYTLACINEPLCVVEYLEDGSTLNIFKQYRRHPKGFRYSRSIELKYANGSKQIIKKLLHLISSTLFIGDFKFFKDNPYKLLTALFLPVGIAFHLYVMWKAS